KVRRTRRAASRGPASTREKPPPGPTSVPVAAHSAVPWQTPFRDTSVTEGYDAKHVRRFQDRDTVELTGRDQTDPLEMHVRFRTRSRLGHPCIICEATVGVQMHHVRHI